MGEFLAELLFVLAELLLEIVVELTGELVLDMVSRLLARSLGEVFRPPEVANPALASAGYVLLGTLAGCLSLFAFPHPFVHPSKIHGISLLVAPIVTGGAMSLVGAVLRARGKRTIRLESFGYAFAFAFGMALVRFLLVK